MAWTLLFVAGVLEIVWAVGMKYSEGFTKPTASVLTVAALIGSFVLLTYSVRSLPIGTAYAVWTGIGAAGTAIAGIVLFNDSREALRLVCIGLVVVGIVGLKIATPE